MKILVCIKQVPISESNLTVDPSTRWLSDEQTIEYRINRFDEFAIEEALQLKSRIPGTDVHVLSVGPDRVTSALQRAVGMGADHAIHIHHPREGLVEARTVAGAISRFAGNHAYDLILTGIMAEDDMQCLVGPLIAANLNLPSAISVVQVQIDPPYRTITVKSELEGGRLQEIRLPLPALISVQSGINQPRYPSLSNLLRSKKQSIEKIETEPEAAKNPLTDLLALEIPPRSENIVFLKGKHEEIADNLINILNKLSVLG